MLTRWVSTPPPSPRYFEEIFNASGNPELVKKYGDWFTYDKNPRAQIFRRNQTLVRDLDSMVRLMRWVLGTPPPPRLQTWVFPPARDFQPSGVIFFQHRDKFIYIFFPPTFTVTLSWPFCRSNNYLRDPLSRCGGCDPPQNAENAISARSDLNPPNGTYPFPALRQRCHGGTDMKVGEPGQL